MRLQPGKLRVRLASTLHLWATRLSPAYVAETAELIVADRERRDLQAQAERERKFGLAAVPRKWGPS